jgi:hypothetical protein
MGQYYKATIINENGDIKTLSPHDFDNGAKLMGFSWCGNNFVNAVLSLIHNKKAKVAFIGDYSNDSHADSFDNFIKSIMSRDLFLKYYHAAWGKDTKYRLQKSHFIKSDFKLLDINTVGTYLVNHDSKEFIDIGAYIEAANVSERDYYKAVNPLPMLTACGNGRGGEDLFSDSTGYGDVGVWAFATLEYTEQIPDAYTQAYFIFKND